MILTRLALEKDRVTLVLAVLLLFGGILSYMGLPKAEDPGFTLRNVIVQTVYPGATASRVEQLVSVPVEAELQGMPAIKEVTSTSRESLSIVKVVLRDEVVDLEPVYAEIRNRMDRVRSELPEEADDPEVKTDIARVYGIVLAVTGDDFGHRELVDAAETLAERVRELPDTGSAKVFGEREAEVVVRYDDATLAENGLSPQALVGLLQQSNVMSPSGVVGLHGHRVAVVPTGAFATLQDVADVPLQLPDGSVVRLGELALVEETLEEPADPEAVYNGRPAVLVGVSMMEGASAAEWGAGVRAKVAELEGDLLLGLEVDELAFEPDDVRNRIAGFTSSLLQAVVIVFLVMLVFLGGRTGTLLAAFIPLVVMTTFLLMGVFGVGIDQMSLAALLIALGMLVDNAIVMAEATVVEMDGGRDPRNAVLNASRELMVPLLVSSLTTIVAFLPIVLAPGNASEFVAPIFQVVTLALLSSWILALTLLPVLLVRFLRPGVAKETHDGPVYAAYRRILRTFIRFRWPTVVGAGGLLVAGIGLFTLVPGDFFPPSEMPAFTVEVRLPSGVDADAGREALEVIGAILEEDGFRGDDGSVGVVAWGAMRGDALPRFKLTYSGPPRAPGSVALLLRTTDRDAIDVLVPQIEQRLEATLPGVQVRGAPLVVGPKEGADLALRFKSRDEEALWRAVDATKAHLSAEPGVSGVRDDWGPRNPRIAVEVDPVRLRLAGLTHQDVGTSMLGALTGLPATDLVRGDERLTVRTRSLAGASDDVAALGNLSVFGQRASSSLSSVATLGLEAEFGQIQRHERRQAVKVEADAARDAGRLQRELAAWVDAQAFEGVEVEGAGASLDASSARRNLLAQAPLAAGVIVMLLLMQFNSFRRVVVNVVVLPFVVPGVAIGLLVLQSSFGFIAMLGLISLFGILLNNGIVLIDRIDTELQRGRKPLDAIVEASVHRARPILLTTATTVLGLLPLYLGGGATFEPMSVVLMGGLTFGTAVTLVLVPVLYATVFRVRA